MSAGVPEGWYYESGDPSVGLFGGGWCHEACYLEGDGTEVEVDEAVQSVERLAGGRVVTTYLLTCKACGATATVQDEDYDPDYDEGFQNLEAVTEGEAQ